MRKLIAAAAVACSALALGACDVDQTEEGEMPEVQGGNMPEYDVEAADVDVGTEKKTVDVPTIDVESPDDAEGEPATGNQE